MSADGFPWLAGRIETVTAASLTAKVLCEYHNSFLSPLDVMVGKSFENLILLQSPQSDFLHIWGPSLEQWMLKVLIGLVSAGQVKVGEKTLQDDDVEKGWLRALFGISPLPNGQGVYMTPQVGQKVQSEKHISISTLNLDGRLAGIRSNLGGIEFLLCLADPERAFNKNHSAYESILFKSKGIDVGNRVGRFKILW